MNKSALKAYAPQARNDFIAAMTARAAQLGISEQQGKLVILPASINGQVMLIDGTPFPASLAAVREQLMTRIAAQGLPATIEAIAYSWFNRLAALRFMELHDGYLEHGIRVLSSATGNPQPDILASAIDIAQQGALPGLKVNQIIELKTAGNKDNELYKILLIAQCNALHHAMPLLFEKVEDDSELLLPDNLLRTDSIISKLVNSLDESDWQEVEVIGWLYQFYISQKKDAVIGKVVKSEDIPAATQLFTPNWIVKYLVQNSVGRLWTSANPNSSLPSQWDYYIPPTEQSEAVNAQLAQLIAQRVSEDGDTLNPESITVLDPACGSGHILVEAYDCLKAMYLERGYRLRDIPRLICEKNLFGLDIDTRAAQLASFALLMKARADDRRLLQNPPKLNIFALQNSHPDHFDHLHQTLASEGISRDPLHSLLTTFEHATTFGSLIQIPPTLAEQLNPLHDTLSQACLSGDIFVQQAAQEVLPLVQQAQLLAKRYDAVIANPPYMGGKGMNETLKVFAKRTFPDSKSDLFAMFIERGFDWCKPNGFNSMVTMQSWMFLSSYETMREKLLCNNSLIHLVQLPYDGKGPTAMGISFGISVAILQKNKIEDLLGDFDCFRYFELTEEGIPKKFPSNNERNVKSKPDDFKKIPGSPIAYWVSDKVRQIFETSPSMGEVADARQGLATADNNRFLRLWQEVSIDRAGFGMENREQAQASGKKWFPYNKGGEFRKWYGNQEYVVNWENDGKELFDFMPRSVIRNPSYYFKPSVSWSFVSSSYFGVRYYPKGFIFDVGGSSLFPKNNQYGMVAGFLCSHIAPSLMKIVNPTLNFQVGNVEQLPYIELPEQDLGSHCITLAKSDWDAYETSWDFTDNPLIRTQQATLAQAFDTWQTQNQTAVAEMKRLEEENNKLFIDAYGLQDELTPDVPDEQITLTRADREKDSQRLMSYAIGCMMGRYSLDETGLVYANAGNIGFDASRYTHFPADADGIVPITDTLWFEDDATQRIKEFLAVVWGEETLPANLAWLAHSLGKKGDESDEDTIRRYLSDKFYKDHLQTYKKRPIYWHFSSGKQGAFQALVYLHRYNESTLARMRAEYVVPLMGKLQSRIEMLTQDAQAATSTPARNKLNKQVENLNKKHLELLAFDEKLRHYADMRITLDLDDGVKVNYGKFGELLSDVKAITGGADD